MKKYLCCLLALGLLAGCSFEKDDSEIVSPPAEQIPEDNKQDNDEQTSIENDANGDAQDAIEYVEKLDSSKDWIYIKEKKDIVYSESDVYPYITQKLIDYGEMYVEYPVINIDSDEIKKVNDEIQAKLDEIYGLTVYSPYSSDSGIYLEKFGYSSSQITSFGDYSSLIIKYQRGDKLNDYTPLPTYDVYTINKITGKLMENSEILEMFGLSEEEAVEKFIAETDKIDLPECVVEENNLVPVNYCYWEEKTLPISRNGKLYIDDNGDLMIIPDCYELVGASKRSFIEPIKLN